MSTKDILAAFSYPFSQVNKNANPNLDLRSEAREWFSQPRSSRTPDWEILTVNLKKPVVMTNLSFELLQKYQKFEVYFTNERNERIRLSDEEGTPVGGTVYGREGAATFWQPFSYNLNATVMKKLELRMQRVSDPKNPSGLFSLGARNILMKRSVYTQQDTLYEIEPEVDFLGNAVRRVVKDWRPELAVDDDAFSFWKSGPQPSPNAVVNFYATLDGATPNAPKRVDRMYIDPVYTGSNLNVYFSNDPTKNVSRPLTKKADYTTNTNIGTKGLNLTNGKNFTINTNKLVNIDNRGSVPGADLSQAFAYKGGWIGGEFEYGVLENDQFDPYFDGIQIFKYGNSAESEYLRLVFFPGSGVMRVYFHNNIAPADYRDFPMSLDALTIKTGNVVKFVFGIEESDDGNCSLRLIMQLGGVNILDTFLVIERRNEDILPYGLVPMFASNGYLTLGDITTELGYFKRAIIKPVPLGEDDSDAYTFLNDPESYMKPMPSGAASVSLVPNYNLDNAIYVGNFLEGDYGYGGFGSETYDAKIWTPIWKDWKVQTGFYYFPEPVYAKYFKLEFSSLTEQPYPIYESGIKVKYKTFPTQTQIASNSTFVKKGSISHPSDNIGTGPLISNTNGQGISAFNRVVPKISVFTFSQTIDLQRNSSIVLPDIINSEKITAAVLAGSATNDIRELSAGIIRSLVTPSSEINNTLADSSNQTIIDDAFGITDTIETATNENGVALGARLPSWWVLPGGKLSIDSSTMDDLTYSSSVTERPVSSSETTTSRTRFITPSIHVYEEKEAIRDVGLAYFAGMRDLKFFSLNYEAPSDTDSYVITKWNEFYSSTSGSTEVSNTQLAATGVGSITSKTFQSVGNFVKVSMETVDRGLRSDTRGFDIEQLGLVSGTSWDDTVAAWADTFAKWGDTTPFTGVDFTSNITFNGKMASKVYRDATVSNTAAGARTRSFNTVANSRIRLCLNLLRPVKTANTIKIQLQVGSAGAILQTFEVDSAIGSWTEYKSPYIKLPANQPDLRINVLVEGTAAETIYISEIWDESTSILYYLSNDNGVTYHEVTEIVDGPGKYFQFPQPGNRLKVKMELWAPYDYAYGYKITPVYLF